MTTLLIVTGASRGIGRAISIAATQKIQSLQLCLLSRSIDELNVTSKLAKDAAKDKEPIDVSCHQIDLGDLMNLEAAIAKISSTSFTAKPYKRAILVSNAGSLGHIGPTMELSSIKDIQSSIDLNVTSGMYLSAWFVRLFGRSDNECATRIINISSLCAIEPFKTMGVYCSAKASRDMFHSVMAKEFEDRQNVKVLNYAPGMVSTDMSISLAKSSTLDAELRHSFKSSHEEQTMIKPNETAEVLVDLLLKDDYDSGSHIDYWDVFKEATNEIHK